MDNNKSSLRKQAEEMSSRSFKNNETQTPGQIQEILHELRVHQIELLMQNEELHKAQSNLEAEKARYFAFYNLSPVGFLTLSEQGQILEANIIATAMLGLSQRAIENQPITRFIFNEDQDIYYLHCKQDDKTNSGLRQDSAGASYAGNAKACELRMIKKDGTTFWVRLESLTVQDHSLVTEQKVDHAPVIRVVVTDINERKQTEAMLQKAFDDIKTLRGIIPICASCKKIRDDEGYWHRVEVYVSDHTEAEFSHGICPVCCEKLYPEQFNKMKEWTKIKAGPQ